MAAFRDKNGREWIVSIPFGLVRKRKQAGQDLLDPIVMADVLDNPYSASDLLWWVCEEQAGKWGVGEDEFHNTAFAVRDTAWAALLEAVQDFFRLSGNATAAAAIARSRAAAERLDQFGVEKIEGGIFDSVVERAMKNLESTWHQMASLNYGEESGI